MKICIGQAGRKPHKEIRTFSTMTQDLEAMRDWLKELGVTHVGMESTGIYWKPVHTILEGQFELIVANAHHIKTVPGPTSRTPSGLPTWCATAWSSRASCHYRPSATCVTWSGFGAPCPRHWPPSRTARSSCWNIKLASVVSQVFGVSGRAMLKALIENTATPQEMADLARRKLRRKLEPLALALDGRLSEHHRYLLAFHLRRVEAIEADLRALDERIEEKPYQAQRRLLRQIPGVDDRIAVAIIAEIGIDMTVFGNAKRLAAWAGVCPGNHESAGKKKSTAARKGNIHLKTTLVQACAARTKGSYYKDKYHRLKARRGAQRATMAIAHKILVAVFHMLAKTIPFQELGEAFLDQQASKRTTLVRRLNNLGYDVLLRPKVAA